jgi:hypothetical protein
MAGWCWLDFEVRVTATRKLFIVAVLLAAGFGVARLMGAPANRWCVPQFGRSAAKAPASTPNPSASASSNSGVRLVPDYGADNPFQLRTDSMALGKVSTPASPPSAVNQNNSSATFPNDLLRPKLRNEAPRPVSIEPRQADFASSPRLLETPSLAPVTTPYASDTVPQERPRGVATAGFLQNPSSNAAAQPAAYAAVPASFTPPNDTPYLNSIREAPAVSPPPWPQQQPQSDDEESGPRTHIVVDGDSLERLAARYLDDAGRANEIFTANRELLATPELLPIGARLVIPDRGASRPGVSYSPHSTARVDSSLRSATQMNLVPVRPIPSSEGIAPRAVLMAPMRAD